jgi:hypothetical protein
MASDFTSYLGVQFKFDSAEARANIVKLLNDLDFFEKKLKNNFDTKAITDWNNKIDYAKEGLYEFGIEVDKVTQQSYQNFRAIGQMDRVTREFASGGLTSGLNGLTMLGNSLTRLSVQEGGFKNAITGLASAFTGPAGIVLGFSALIGIIEANKDKISEFFKTPLTAQEAYKNSITSIGTEFTSAVDKVNVVKNAFDEYNKGIITGNAALKIYNEQLGEIFGSKTNINDAEEVFKNKTKDYIEASFQRALADAAGKKASEEFLKQKLIEQKSLSEYKGFVSGANLSGQIDVVNFSAINKRTAQGFKDVEINTQAEIVKLYQGIQKKAQAESDNISKQGGFNLFPDKSKKPIIEKTDYEAILKQQRLEFYPEKILSEKMGKKDLSYILGETPEEAFKAEQKRISYFTSKLKVLKEQMSSETGIGELLKKDAEKRVEAYKLEDDAAAENAKQLKIQEQDYKNFAKTLSKDVTNALFSVFDAIKKGQNPLESIGNAFAKMVEQIAAAIIEGLIFKALLDSFPELKGVFAAVGAVSSAFGGGYSGPHADGGITTRASIGMIGESGPEAIMPLSKLGSMMSNTFNAGSMSGTNSSNGGQFVLRGQDLLVSLNRTQKSSALKGQNISLA